MSGQGLLEWGRRLHRDERGLVGKLFIRTLVMFALVAVVGYEVAQIVIAQAHAGSVAKAAADAGADALFTSGQPAKAEEAVLGAAKAEDPKATVTSVKVGTDRTVTVTVEVTAKTLVVQRFSFTRKLGLQHASAERSRSG
jgi:hypothetical protein